MKTGLTLVDLAKKIEANAQMKRDFIIPTETTTMQVMEDKVAVLEVVGQGTFPVQALPHRQIAEHLKIPKPYYDRMQADAPDLLATNVNAWFRKNPERRMLRTLGGDARAFLSNRYQRIENEKIAEVALPVLADFPQVKIVSADVTDARLYIQAVVPTIQGEVVGHKVGDVLQAGVVISNSEVGLGRVDVSEMDYRLVCLNGMIGQSLLKRTHVGRQIDDNEALWADDTRRADDDVLVLKIRDMVRAALDATRFRARLDKISGLAQAQITGDVTKAVEVLSNVVQVSEGEKGSILKSLINGGDLSAWGLINAVTHQAHEVADYDRGVELEQMGGRLLNLAPTEWKRVLEAA